MPLNFPLQDDEVRINRRKDKPPRQRFEQMLERVIAEAEAGRFPISYRPSDCERFSQFPIRLNAAHASGDPDTLRQELAVLVRVLMNSSA